MRLLVVEDDDAKREALLARICAFFPGLTVSTAKSHNGALRMLVDKNSRIDLLVLDMSMPNYDKSEDPPETYAGRDLLHQLKLRKVSVPTLVVTQFDLFGIEPDQKNLEQLDSELNQLFSPHYRGIVHYSSADESWKAKLDSLIQGMINDNQDSHRGR